MDFSPGCQENRHFCDISTRNIVSQTVMTSLKNIPLSFHVLVSRWGLFEVGIYLIEPTFKNGDYNIMTMMMMVMMIVFAEWLADERRQVLFSSRAIVIDSQHRNFSTRHKQVLNFHRIYWIKLCSGDEHYIMALHGDYFRMNIKCLLIDLEWYSKTLITYQ